MNDRFASLRRATVAALLGGHGAAATETLRAVMQGAPPPELEALVRKIRTRAYTVTDQDLDALRSRYTEDQLFEIVVAAACGAADERLEAARRALDQA
jgi:hypothetical protein